MKPSAKEVFSPAKPHAQKLKSTIKARFPTKLDQMGQKGSGRQALGVAYGGLVNGGESSGRDSALFGESFKVHTFRKTLIRLKTDVESCLKWVDLGLMCGLIRLALRPKSFEGPHAKPNLFEGPKVKARLKTREDKGKAKLGFEGSRPKFSFKPKLCKWVLSQPAILIKEQGSNLKLVTVLGPKNTSMDLPG